MFELHVGIEVFRREGFLHEIKIEFLEPLSEPACLGQIEAAMRIDHQVDIRPHRLADLPDTFHGNVLLLWCHRMGNVAEGAPL